MIKSKNVSSGEKYKRLERPFHPFLTTALRMRMCFYTGERGSQKSTVVTLVPQNVKLLQHIVFTQTERESNRFFGALL